MRSPRVALLLLLAGWGGSVSSQAEPDLYDDHVLRTIELTFHQSGWWSQLLANRTSETYLKADLRIDTVSLKDVGVRLRGGTSFRDAAATGKYPFRISMDTFVPGQRLWGRRGTVRGQPLTALPSCRAMHSRRAARTRKSARRTASAFMDSRAARSTAATPRS